MASPHAVEETTYEGYLALKLRAPEAGLEVTYAPRVGMVGCSLKHRGEELLGQRGGLAKYEATGSTMGIPLLHPWANRLEGFGYSCAGKQVEIDPDSPLIKENPKGLPIHGVCAASPHWELVHAAADADGALLSARLDFAARPEYMEAFPYPHELAMEVRLAGPTLTVATTLTATGDDPVPVSFGYHPYLQLPEVPRGDWHVELPLKRRLVLDEQMIPTGDTERVDYPPGPLGERTFDDGYDELAEPATFVLAGGGRRLELRFDEGYGYAQVYAPPDQDLISYEPMTAPTNALASGDDALTLVEPGTSYRAVFSLTVAAAA